MKRKMDLGRRSTLRARLQVYLTMVQSQSVFVVLVFISTTQFINKLCLLTQYNNIVIFNLILNFNVTNFGDFESTVYSIT